VPQSTSNRSTTNRTHSPILKLRQRLREIQFLSLTRQMSHLFRRKLLLSMISRDSLNSHCRQSKRTLTRISTSRRKRRTRTSLSSGSSPNIAIWQPWSVASQPVTCSLMMKSRIRELSRWGTSRAMPTPSRTTWSKSRRKWRSRQVSFFNETSWIVKRCSTRPRPSHK